MDPKYTISIDRDSSKWAIFDGPILKHAFARYTDEAEALKEAKRVVALWTDKEPKVVYPRITSMRVTYMRTPKPKKMKS